MPSRHTTTFPTKHFDLRLGPAAQPRGDTFSNMLQQTSVEPSTDASNMIKCIFRNRCSYLLGTTLLVELGVVVYPGLVAPLSLVICS